MVNTQLQKEGKKTPNNKTDTNNPPPSKLINSDYSIHLLFVPSSWKSRVRCSIRKNPKQLKARMTNIGHLLWYLVKF